MDRQERTRLYGIIVTILLLLAAALGWYFWNKSKTYLADKEAATQRIDSLLLVKKDLEYQLDTLGYAFEGLQAENENLQGRLADVASKVRAKENIIRQIKSENTRNEEDLRNQISALQNARTEYQTTIELLQAENAQLKSENTSLKEENEGLKGNITTLNTKVDDLAKKLAEQIQATQSAKFKATSFKVEVDKRKDRLTSRAKKAKEISVSFDLANVPESYQGNNTLYLVITDGNGTPIPSGQPTKTTVKTENAQIDIIAQQTKSVILENNQRFSFNYTLSERLKPGNYVAAIYCEQGLLGASSVRLR